MSRKSRALTDLTQDQNLSPQIWIVNLGYSAFKPDLKTGKLPTGTIVILFHNSLNKDLSDGGDERENDGESHYHKAIRTTRKLPEHYTCIDEN